MIALQMPTLSRELTTQAEQVKRELPKFEIRERLTDYQWKNQGLKKVIPIAVSAVYAELKKNPHKAFSFVLLGAAFPALVGSWACLKTFQITPLGDLESSDPQVSMPAAQNIGNTGMAITYLVQLEEFVLHPITRLFTQRYNKMMCEKIRAYYINIRNINHFSDKETQYLVEIENQQLSDYNGLPISPCPQVTEEVDSIQEEIDATLNKRLSTGSIIYLTYSQIKEDVLDSSFRSGIKKVLMLVPVIGLFGFCNTVLGIGTYGCYKPFDIQDPFELASSDSVKVDNAVANYANAGHGLEYAAVMAMLSVKAMSMIVGNQYKEAKKRVIRESYIAQIHNPSLSFQAKDFLSKRMNFTLRNELR